MNAPTTTTNVRTLTAAMTIPRNVLTRAAYDPPPDRPGRAGRAYAVCIAGFAKIRNIFRRKPLTDDELRRRQEAALAKERLGDAKLVDRRGTMNADELRRR
jgi:hypothetical protein